MSDTDATRELLEALALEGERKARAARRAANIMANGPARYRMYGVAQGAEWAVEMIRRAARRGD
jgi:hypothetical protein